MKPYNATVTLSHAVKVAAKPGGFRRLLLLQGLEFLL
jgi:hypothetical protein